MWVLVFGLSGVSSSRSSIGTITLYVDYELQYDLLSVNNDGWNNVAGTSSRTQQLGNECTGTFVFSNYVGQTKQ
jgi:hypothetical protein